LQKNGHLIRLQEQPFLLLAALLDRAGEVVTREELRALLWPGDSFGDFDQGLNTAINKVREALGDSAGSPSFIETLPKRGYRFIHPIAAEPATAPDDAPPVLQQSAEVSRSLIPLAAIVIVGISMLAIVWTRWPRQDTEIPLRRFSVEELAEDNLTPDVRRVAISPNGKHIAFINGDGQSRLWIRDLNQQEARAVEGTEGALSAFWSPDSSAIGVSTLGRLRTFSVAGESMATVVDLPGTYISGGSWSPDGRSIVFAAGPPASLYIVAAVGGTPSLLLSPQMLSGPNTAEEERGVTVRGCIAHPHFLPAKYGSSVVFTWFGEKTELMLIDLKNRHTRVIGEGSHPFYSPSGHLLYRSGSDLWFRSFSAERMQFAGEASRVARGAVDPTVAADGTLVYRDEVNHQLVWFDRTGTRIGKATEPAKRIYYPSLSTDGRQVAMELWEPDNLEVWVADLQRATRIRLTSHPATDVVPVWSPRGDQIAFSSYRAGDTDIFVRRSDAGSQETALAATPLSERASDWSQDGQYILYSVRTPANGLDIRYMKRTERAWESNSLLETAFNERSPKFSPDGRYIAYISDESGRDELYVQPFPSGRRKWPISSGGASQVRWSRSNELFYTEGRTLITVSVKTKPAFAAGARTPLFSHSRFTSGTDAHYDVSHDGQRIILPDTLAPRPPNIHLVQNWLAEFRERQ
jgi:Tol biopolymer transport system component/DNA-binding winged helix-turn-helix (wHTH) protein